MSKHQDPDLTSETETVKQVFAAINRNDITAALKFFDADAERIEPPGFPSAGTYHGHAELLKHFTSGRCTWAEGGCDPERLLVSGDKVIALLHIHVRLTDKTEWIDARIADGFIFRNGKIIQMRSFAEAHEALEWAGLKA